MMYAKRYSSSSRRHLQPQNSITKAMFTTRLLRGAPRALFRFPRRTAATTPLSRRPHRPPSTHIPTAAAQRAEAAAHKRRQALLVFGCVMSMTAIWLITHMVEIKAETLPSTPNIKPGTPILLPTQAEKGADVELVPSGTSVPAFPKTLTLDGSQYVLVGLGIRTVSFLGIEVYVVGLYIAADDLASLQAALIRRVHPTATAATQAERDALRTLLSDPVEGEQLFEALLQERIGSILRIVPTRNTDYQHLRDGWVRGIQARSSKSPVYDDDRFAVALSRFKAAFGQKKVVPKQKTLLLVRDADGALRCFYDASGRNDGKVGGEGEKGLVLLGEVGDRRVSTALWLCYLAGAKVASEPARKNVIEGLTKLVERPIGSVGVAV